MSTLARRPTISRQSMRLRKNSANPSSSLYYDPDPTTPTILQCDASQTGIGAWLRQLDSHENENIVAMASRSLTEAESRVLGRHIWFREVWVLPDRSERDSWNRPLPLGANLREIHQRGSKQVAEATPKMPTIWRPFPVQARVIHPSCWCPVTSVSQESRIQPRARDRRHFDLLAEKSSTAQDHTKSLLKSTIFNGWPPYRKQCPQELREFWSFRCDLTLEDGLVLKGSRIVIPASMRSQVLQAIHLGHQGENKCILRAWESVFWPGISTDIRQMVKNCDLCRGAKVYQSPSSLILNPST